LFESSFIVSTRKTFSIFPFVIFHFHLTREFNLVRVLLCIFVDRFGWLTENQSTKSHEMKMENDEWKMVNLFSSIE